jgi:hypothetical protein
MTLPKFSVKNDIQAQHYVTVTLTKLGQPQQDNYGKNKYESECTINGTPHAWTLSENMYKNITSSFKQGDTFCVLKWKNGDKMGYNYLPVGDIQIKNATPMDKVTPPNPCPQEPTYNEPPQPTEKVINEPKPRDYDAENRGKIRHGVACAYIRANRTLNDSSKKEIIDWTEFIFTGK